MDYYTIYRNKFKDLLPNLPVENNDHFGDALLNAFSLYKYLQDNNQTLSQRRKLNMYEDIVQLLLYSVYWLREWQELLVHPDRLKNKNLPWTSQEDDRLVELAAECYKNKIDFAPLAVLTFRRSTNSVRTRLSQLIGKERLSQEIEGLFSGLLNGNDIEGFISGTLNKKSKE